MISDEDLCEIRYNAEIELAYKQAAALGLTGFDVDMDLTPYQNLDMAKAGFSPSESNPNEWELGV